MEMSPLMSAAAILDRNHAGLWVGACESISKTCCFTCLVAYTAYVLWSAPCHVGLNVGRQLFVGELPVLPSAVQRQTHLCGPLCRYHDSIEKAKAALPFDAGFEAVGVVAAVAPGVEGKFTRHATCD